ncbi:unnamed protein product [Lota lota]
MKWSSIFTQFQSIVASVRTLNKRAQTNTGERHPGNASVDEIRSPLFCLNQRRTSSGRYRRGKHGSLLYARPLWDVCSVPPPPPPPPPTLLLQCRRHFLIKETRPQESGGEPWVARHGPVLSAVQLHNTNRGEHTSKTRGSGFTASGWRKNNVHHIK